jgi:hypothetical protein
MLNQAAIRVVRDVREWLSDRAECDDPDVGWLVCADAPLCLELLLEARENWLTSPDPTLWKTGDAHRLLIDTVAPRLTDIHGLREHGPSVLRALVDFLDDTDRFHPASMRAAALRKELDRAAAKYPVAMADESVWRLAKRIFTAMRADGVDVADDTAVDAWADAFSGAPTQRRRAVLGVLLDRQPELLTCQFVIRDNQVAAIAPGMPVPAEFHRHDPDTCSDCLSTPVNPAVLIPPIDELADSARESVLLSRMVACGRWVGSGRAVTKLGFPSPVDTRSLAAALGAEIRDRVRDPRDHIGLIRAWRLALDAEVLRLHRTEVVAGPAYAALEQALAGDTDPQDTVRLWKKIADIAVSGPTRLAVGDDHRMSRLDEFARPWGPRALGEMYRINEEVDLDDLVDKLITDYHGPDAEEMLSMMAGAAVRAGQLAGTEAGVVAVTVPADAELDPMARRSAALLDEPIWAVVSVPGTRVGLTPLGRHMVRLNLLAAGTTAPLLEPAN